MKKFVSIALSLFLAFFLADALLSVLDDALILALDVHLISLPRALLALLFFVASIVIYFLMALTPMIPKRWFVPATLFIPAGMLATIPVSIYAFHRLMAASLAISLVQLILAVWILKRVQGRLSLRWPLVADERIEGRSFSWTNLAAFVAANLFLLAPLTLAYLAICLSLAANHFSEGFLRLRPSGVILQARTYTRDDGRTIELIPMMHVGKSDFYSQVTKSFPSNSIALLEGVSDEKHLLEHKLSYKRLADSLGLAEQHEGFTPSESASRRADVDIDQFSKTTIEILNLVTQFYSEGLDRNVLVRMLMKSSDPKVGERLWDDLLTKRNEHLLQEIQTELAKTKTIVVPWGAMHMPGLAAEIEKSGFRVSRTRDFEVMNFRSVLKPKPSKKEHARDSK
jgi:hypothetical protein